MAISQVNKSRWHEDVAVMRMGTFFDTIVDLTS